MKERENNRDNNERRKQNNERRKQKIMKTNPIIGTIAAAAVFMAVTALAQQFNTTGLQQVSRDQVPDFCTVWVLRSDGLAVPLPCLPLNDLDAPVYALANGSFLLDASEIEDSPMAALGMDMALEDDSGGDPPPIPNYQKFMEQVFSLVDTNNAAVNDTNLYNACVSIPDDGNTGPHLQIALYGPNAVVIKANHFDTRPRLVTSPCSCAITSQHRRGRTLILPVRLTAKTAG